MLDIIDEEQLCQRVQRLGAQLVETLQGAKASCPGIVAIRAQGSMVAVEFNDPAMGKPSADLTRRYQQAALEQSLLLLTCGVHGNVIRFPYPLTIPDAQFS